MRLAAVTSSPSASAGVRSARLTRFRKSHDHELLAQAVASTVRILGDARRVPGKNEKGLEEPPAPVRNYLNAVADRAGLDATSFSPVILSALKESKQPTS